MTLYADSEYPVSPAIETLHANEIASYARPGTWGSAAQRTAIAATARMARCEAGVQESASDEALANLVDLPVPARRLARAVARCGTEIDREFCQQVQAEGVTEGAYVEIVGLVSRLANLDVFARGIDLQPRTLLQPIDDKSPSYERPAEAIKEGFFTATVPNAPAGGALAVSLYGENPTGNILRTLSLVPDEARRLISLVSQQYFTADKLLSFAASAEHALSRAQIELVATKVSEHNKCFYWTTWHTYLLRESGKANKQTYQLAGAIDASIDSGVEHGRELVSFADALMGSDLDRLSAAREVIANRLGRAAVTTASIIAANFSMLDRAANAIGISVDSMILEPSADFREQLAINKYPSAANTLG